MTINEAVDTWLSYEDSDRYDEEKSRKVIEARITIREALRRGYKLCKVDEALEQMTELKDQENKGIQYYYPPYYSERCITILQEACDDDKGD